MLERIPPVVGVIMMVTITVIISAILAALIFGAWGSMANNCKVREARFIVPDAIMFPSDPADEIKFCVGEDCFFIDLDRISPEQYEMVHAALVPGKTITLLISSCYGKNYVTGIGAE